MSAYLIYFCHDFRDKQGHIEYSKGISDTLGGVEIKVHVAYTRFEILEGPANVEGVVVIEFPSYEIAKRWYDSPEYKALRGHRIRNNYTGILVEGGVTPLLERFPHVE